MAETKEEFCKIELALFEFQLIYYHFKCLLLQ